VTGKSEVSTPGAELVLTRAFDAPRGEMFRAWTDPKCFAQW